MRFRASKDLIPTAIAIFLLTVNSLGHSNELSGNTLTATSPLSRLIEQPTITSVYQDSNQILWVGTQQGLYRFNGSNVRAFNSKQHGKHWLPTSDIRGIAQDIYNNVVIATFGSGLFRYEESEERFVSFLSEELTNEKYITSIYSTSSGTIWIGTPKATYAFNKAERHWSNLPEVKDSLRKIGPAIEITSGQENRTIIASKRSVWVVNEKNASFELIFSLNGSSNQGYHITSIDYDSEEGLYLGTSDGKVLQLDVEPMPPHQMRSNPDMPLKVPNAISNLLYYKNNLLIGTGNGLYQMNTRDGSLEEFTKSNTNLPNNHVTDLFLADNLVWIGTYQGLGTLTFSPFITYNEKNTGISNDVLAFGEDTDGRIWVGTYTGLYRSTTGKTRRGTRFEKVPTLDPRVMAIAEDSSELWVGFRQGGIQVFDIRSGKSHMKEGFKSRDLAVTNILHSRSSTTWIGTYGNGLFRIGENKNDAESLIGLFPEPIITLLLELDNNDLLIGAEKTLYRYSSTKKDFQQIRFEDENLPHSRLILSMNQNSHGVTFIGTKDTGLYRMENTYETDNDTILRKVKSSGVASQSSIYGIEFDEQQNIWLSTHEGLFKLDRNGNYISNFNKSDGLQGNDFNFGASFKSRGGDIFFGGINGFTQFNPNAVNITAKPSDLLLTAIRYSNEGMINLIDLPSISTLELTHKNYFVTFEFSVLDFLDPENNQYRYKLDNFDPEWIDNGTRNTATYTNLPAGDYVFRVQGANSAGIWNRDGLELQVRVLPAPWLTWWAYMAYLLGAILFLWVCQKIYNNFTARRHAEQRAIEARAGEERAQDEIQEHLEVYDELLGLSHNHNLATLDLIKNFMRQQRNSLEEKIAVKSIAECESIISSLALLEQCLFFQEEELTVDMHKFTDLLFSELLVECTENPESIITINDTVKRRVPAQIASPLSAFINEAVRNSLQHAFEDGSHANYLQVSLKIDGEIHRPDSVRTYKLIVSDNGCGIPESILPESGQSPGFAAMLSLADMLGGKVNISSNGGTRVEITVPIAPA